MSELDILKKMSIGNCCSNKPTYLITYQIGTRWYVCNDCVGSEYFKSYIVKKVEL